MSFHSMKFINHELAWWYAAGKNHVSRPLMHHHMNSAQILAGTISFPRLFSIMVPNIRPMSCKLRITSHSACSHKICWKICLYDYESPLVSLTRSLIDWWSLTFILRYMLISQNEHTIIQVCLCGAMRSTSALTRLIQWVACSSSACVIVGRCIGSGSAWWLPLDPSNIQRQIPEMATKRNFNFNFNRSPVPHTWTFCTSNFVTVQWQSCFFSYCYKNVHKFIN